MGKMYPNEQVIEVFGEQVKWPGLGPDGKFTNGSFTDPSVKPSFIPAGTLNLLIDNMEQVIEEAGLAPNNIEPDQLVKAFQALEKSATLENRIIGEYRFFSYQPSPLQLAKWRCLPIQYQIIEIALYPDLCATKWVGAGLNATADYWYKCDENGTRNPDGLYMRVEDGRGMFYRGAGANAIKKGANNAPYDGGNIGQSIGDAIRDITGRYYTRVVDSSMGATIGNPIGAFSIANTGNNGAPIVLNEGGDKELIYLHFNASNVVPTASENRPASTSTYNCITY